jgi:hypothetical protein
MKHFFFFKFYICIYLCMLLKLKFEVWGLRLQAFFKTSEKSVTTIHIQLRKSCWSECNGNSHLLVVFIYEITIFIDVMHDASFFPACHTDFLFHWAGINPMLYEYYAMLCSRYWFDSCRMARGAIRSLLLEESFYLCWSNQYILVRVIPSCFWFVKMCLCQVILLSRCNLRYLTSCWGSCTLFIWTRGAHFFSCCECDMDQLGTSSFHSPFLKPVLDCK